LRRKIMYTLGALLLLAVLLGSVTAVVNSVFGVVGLSATIGKIPVIGAHWGLLVSIGMMAVLDLNIVGGWIPGMTDQWMIIVANGAIVYGMGPVKDAVISMVSRGLRA
jgi:hypothetical protein